MDVVVMLSESRRKKKQKSPEMARRSAMLKLIMPILSDENGIALSKAIAKSDGDAAYESLVAIAKTVRARLSKK